MGNNLEQQIKGNFSSHAFKCRIHKVDSFLEIPD
jgi:hypothetical protein